MDYMVPTWPCLKPKFQKYGLNVNIWWAYTYSRGSNMITKQSKTKNKNKKRNRTEQNKTKQNQSQKRRRNGRDGVEWWRSFGFGFSTSISIRFFRGAAKDGSFIIIIFFFNINSINGRGSATHSDRIHSFSPTQLFHSSPYLTGHFALYPYFTFTIHSL